MKRNFTFFLIVSLISCHLKAQDTIIKRNHSKTVVKIKEIGLDEIKYKMFNNLTGPDYIEKRSEILVIIYANGDRDVINREYTGSYSKYNGEWLPPKNNLMTKQDSLQYYKYKNSVSFNFVNFFNNEVGFIFQHDLYLDHFALIVPVGFGVEEPKMTQKRYFNQSFRDQNGYSVITLVKKLFEGGIGASYYPTYKNHINYFIGPVFRYMQYQAINNYSGRTGAFYKNTTLHRYSLSITNGVTIRSKSRLNASAFVSLGFVTDNIQDKITDPVAKKAVNPFSAGATKFYAWFGFNTGFSF